MFHSRYSPRLNRNTTKLKPQIASKLNEGLKTIGSTRTNSTSKITNTTAKIKNRKETGARVSFILLNPHSKGDKYSRDRASYFEKRRPSPKKSSLKIILITESAPQKKIYLLGLCNRVDYRKIKIKAQVNIVVATELITPWVSSKEDMFRETLKLRSDPE